METGTSSKEIVARLERIAAEDPGLGPAAAFYAAVLPLVPDRPAVYRPLGITAEAAAARLGAGKFLLQDQELEIDVPSVLELLLRLAEAAARSGSLASASLLRDRLDLRQGTVIGFLQGVLAGDTIVLRDAAAAWGMSQGFCRALSQSAVAPVMRAWQRDLAPLVPDHSWEQGACYVCGTQALLGEFRGNSQERHLRCGLCGADWRIRRLLCPWCGNEDHRTLGVLSHGADPTRPRIDACGRCNGYLKVIPAFSPTPVGLLAVEDLATVSLDQAAMRQGFWRQP